MSLTPDQPDYSLPAVNAFQRCMVDADSSTQANQRRTRRRSMGLSIILECAALAAALIYPLFVPVNLVAKRDVLIPIPPYGAPHPVAEPLPSSGRHPSNGPAIVVLRPLSGIRGPLAHPVFHGAGTDPSAGVPDVGLGDSSGGSQEGVIPLGDLRPNLGMPSRPEPPKSAPAPVLRRSEGVQSAMLIHRVEPLYPPIAKQTHTQGTVQLHAVIARDGSIESLEVLSGNALLIQAARDAVRQWRYRPTLLGGEPVEVDTYITVIFRLGDN
ncbi:MAG TPA: energy transducer TonB [Candidatus Acidoferrales bacterium]|nr:energy transducer TonB [Candidatus Acidoferrales bacterium]